MIEPRRVLFVALLNDPGSDRIVAEMGRLGAHCAVAGPLDCFAAKSRYALELFGLPGWGGSALRSLLFGYRLEEIVRVWSPEMIIPMDDLASRALRDKRVFRRASPTLRRLLEFSFGAHAFFDVAGSRQRVMELARRIGVRAPRTEVIPDLDAARRAVATLGYPAVLKRELTCGGRGVTIVEDEVTLCRTFRRQHAWAAAKSGLRWIPGFSLDDAAPLTLQEFIPGALAFRVAACADGQELEGVDFIAEQRDVWETGASLMVRRFANDEMRESTRKIIGALKCSGIVSLDFILDVADGAYFIELNARPIACGHLGRLFGHDVLAAALDRDRPVRRGRATVAEPPEVIALFPRAIDAEPTSRKFESSSNFYHDVPWEDQEVVEAYAAWLDRRHPDRRPVLPRPWPDVRPQSSSFGDGAAASA